MKLKTFTIIIYLKSPKDKPIKHTTQKSNTLITLKTEEAMKMLAKKLTVKCKLNFFQCVNNIMVLYKPKSLDEHVQFNEEIFIYSLK